MAMHPFFFDRVKKMKWPFAFWSLMF
jgi:hypothetical protein